ncbi:hypothetical protein ID850_14810 [Xenorhabdus sp. Flor]|uniref:hypothetical protein n=1 Tax=Xenorhabdus cabanillasii TaxID=351673 RepID=UPI0019A23174|nr:hypothetical protein [Xenorhabdus sp. Flor]MBD2816002.1 hypothetical protein [Xenorhabdus sp. Flor]
MKNNISIDENSISIYFEKEIFQILDYDILPPDGECIKAIALIRDKEGKPLPNTPVAILEKEYAYFDLVNIYHADKSTPVEIKNITADLRSFSVTSDDNGKLVFYIYPKKSTPLIFQVDSMVVNKTSRISSKNKVYIIDNNNKDLGLPSPDIIGDDGKLWVDPTSNFFTLIVKDYPGARINDTILFFVNNKYIKESFFVEDVNKLGNSAIRFLYNILRKNELSHFSYTVVDQTGMARSSYPQNIVYPGGGYNQPISGIKRTHDHCIVYNSAGYNNDNNIIINSIHEKDIAHRCSNPHHEGLFIKIIGTSDYRDKTKVPFGAEITLNLYVNDYPNTIYQSKSKLMPTKPDRYGDVTASLLFGVPLKYVGHINSGRIHVDFQVNYYGDISYGNVWQANIYTMRPGGELPGDACPDGKTWSDIW